MNSGAGRLFNSSSRYWGIYACIVFSVLLLGQDQSPAKASGQEPGLQGRTQAHSALAIGSPAPDFSLTGVDDKKHQLSEYGNGHVLAIVFTCNTCAVSQMYEDRIKKLVTDYGSKGVSVVAIQPNSEAAESSHQLSYTDVDDSLDGMKTRATFRGFNFPYLYDGDNKVAQEYGPTATPDMFIFDKLGKLSYEGRLDDNVDEAKVKVQDARDALDQLLAGKPVAVSHTSTFGCNIVSKDQTEAKQAETKDWQAKPVNLDLATADVLQKLRANPTGKFLMVNFWATWCGPCVSEFDDLQQTYLWYRSRDFELVTVSADSPDAKDGVLQFLKDHYSGVRNLEFSSDDVYGMQAAFDKRWDSGVPYTIVIAPDGAILYEEAGAVHLLRLRRAILASLPDEGPFTGDAAYWVKVLEGESGLLRPALAPQRRLLTARRAYPIPVQRL